MRRGFTLIELLVVIAIIALLMGILVPALGKIRRQARSIMGAADQYQVVRAVFCYGAENEDRFPESVARLGVPSTWGWFVPNTLTSVIDRAVVPHRSVSGYLGSYISNASLMACRNAPREHEYLQDVWDAQDDWIYPGIPPGVGILTTTYSFYWGYTGYLGPGKQFKGPSNISGRSGESTLMMSCYFEYNNWLNSREGLFTSCERFRNAGVGEEWAHTSASYWSSLGPGEDLSAFRIKLHAAYTDGHVGSYSASEVVPMEVIPDPTTGLPYPRRFGDGPGIFFLPEDAVR